MRWCNYACALSRTNQNTGKLRILGRSRDSEAFRKSKTFFCRNRFSKHEIQIEGVRPENAGIQPPSPPIPSLCTLMIGSDFFSIFSWRFSFCYDFNYPIIVCLVNSLKRISIFSLHNASFMGLRCTLRTIFELTSLHSIWCGRDCTCRLCTKNTFSINNICFLLLTVQLLLLLLL